MGNKMKKYILSLLAVGSQGADFTGDTDASCNLLDATCDHTGFTITFDTACQASDYKAVQWDELYADGWAQQDSNTNLYGSASTAASECRFQDNAGVIEMKFNFKQCGTDHPDSNATDIIYRNTIQAQEYYADVLMGVKVRFQVSCAGDRDATISQQTSDIEGDKEHEATDNEDRLNWANDATNLGMSFYKDAGLTQAYDGTSVVAPFGEDIYMHIGADETFEDMKLRITDCWATKDADSTSTPKFDLIQSSCVANDPETSSALLWVNLDSTTNGDDQDSSFGFRAFRFAGQMTVHLHCNVWICHDDEDCTETCSSRRRRGIVDETRRRRDADGEDNFGAQETVSAVIEVPDSSNGDDVITDSSLQNSNLLTALQRRFEKMRLAYGPLRKTIRKLGEKYLG